MLRISSLRYNEEANHLAEYLLPAKTYEQL